MLDFHSVGRTPRFAVAASAGGGAGEERVLLARARRERRAGRGLPDCLAQQVLLLNRYYAPVSLTSVRRGMSLLFAGNARALDAEGGTHDFTAWRRLPVPAGEDWVPIVDGRLRVPRVLHLERYDRVPRVTLRSTRANIMLRDGHQCQYCGDRPGVRALNLDHVLPRSRGGADSWENLVTSCRRCNLRKGRRTPEEAGMALTRLPGRPRWSLRARIVLASQRLFAEWEPFLGAG